MVIEDDPDGLEALSAVLEHGGYAVIEVILLDLMLPVMDGWQFLAEQRARPALASIPVVLVSGERDLRRRATELGVAGALVKPVEIDELLSIIEQLVQPAG
jgi:CheY-like chemotaxis protein